MSEITYVKCPHCQQTVAWIPQNSYRPFCSKRCQLIDLGAWTNEENTIQGEERGLSLDNDELSNTDSDDFIKYD